MPALFAGFSASKLVPGPWGKEGRHFRRGAKSNSKRGWKRDFTSNANLTQRSTRHIASVKRRKKRRGNSAKRLSGYGNSGFLMIPSEILVIGSSTRNDLEDAGHLVMKTAPITSVPGVGSITSTTEVGRLTSVAIALLIRLQSRQPSYTFACSHAPTFVRCTNCQTSFFVCDSNCLPLPASNLRQSSFDSSCWPANSFLILHLPLKS